MTPFKPFSFLFAVLCFAACGIPAKFQAYTRADRPLFAAINELNRHPHNIFAQEDLRILYAQALARHEHNIKIYSTSNYERRLYKVLYELEALQHIYYCLQLNPLAFAIAEPRDYSQMIESIQAAADYYASMQEETQQYQEAMDQDNDENR